MGEKQTVSDLFQVVFSSPEGKEVLKEIKEYCGVGQMLWADTQLAQNAAVVRHDVAIWIEDLAKQKEK